MPPPRGARVFGGIRRGEGSAMKLLRLFRAAFSLSLRRELAFRMDLLF